MKRRTFMKGMSSMVLLPMPLFSLSACAQEEAKDSLSDNLVNAHVYMPEEGEPHAATWMAFGATAQAWGTTGAYGLSRKTARQDLMRVAVNLSRFEPVNMLVSPQDMVEAQAALEQARLENDHSVFSDGKPLPKIEAGGLIQLIEQAVDDLWMRDTGPVFVIGGDRRLSGVNFNFNGWGQGDTGAKGWKRDSDKAKNGIGIQPIGHDIQVADFILKRTQATKISTWLVLEGGGVEVDGEGTAICTESCILNANRNPNRSKAEVELELKRVLGIHKVIWLPGLKAHDITDGHIDFYARFIALGQVAYGLDNDPESPEYELTHQHEVILKGATDAKGRALKITPLIAPNADKVAESVLKRNRWKDENFNEDSFAAGYIGFFAANNCVLMQQFGDAVSDWKAYQAVQRLYPDRTVMQISTDGLANGGGTIHCATQQQPKSVI